MGQYAATDMNTVDEYRDMQTYPVLIVEDIPSGSGVARENVA